MKTLKNPLNTVENEMFACIKYSREIHEIFMHVNICSFFSATSQFLNVSNRGLRQYHARKFPMAHIHERLKMDKEWGQAHPFELNTGKTIHCMEVNFMQQVMSTFQKRSALREVFSKRVGNIPILSILSL